MCAGACTAWAPVSCISSLPPCSHPLYLIAATHSSALSPSVVRESYTPGGSMAHQEKRSAWAPPLWQRRMAARPPCQYPQISAAASAGAVSGLKHHQQICGKLWVCLHPVRGPGPWPARAPCRHALIRFAGCIRASRVGAGVGVLQQPFQGVRIVFSPGAAATSHVHEAGRQRRGNSVP